MDVHVPFAITAQLRLRDIDILTAQEDDSRQREDSQLLDRATDLQRVLVSQDIDLLQITALRTGVGSASPA
jgi:predicted nuclease of predicted toxin-antitoxin system